MDMINKNMMQRIYISKFTALIKGKYEFSISTVLALDELTAEKESIQLMTKAYEIDNVKPQLICTRVVPDEYVIAAYQSLKEMSKLL